MQMFISSASILVRSPHQGRLLSLQKVTLYWLPIDRFCCWRCFFLSLLSVPLCFVSLALCLCPSSFICFRTLSVLSCLLCLFCFILSSPCYIPQMPFDVFLSFSRHLQLFISFFLPLHSSSIIYLRAAPSWVLLWVPSGADHSQSRRSAHVLVCVWM